MNQKKLLETWNLIKSFRGRKIIDNLNLTVMRGDIYGFRGRNGQGKTTTIRLITGLIFPDSGDVMINGYNLSTDFKRSISQIGAIVEACTFYEYLSGYENLSFHEMYIYSTSSRQMFSRFSVIAAYIIFFYIGSIVLIKKKDMLL